MSEPRSSHPVLFSTVAVDCWSLKRMTYPVFVVPYSGYFDLLGCTAFAKSISNVAVSCFREEVSCKSFAIHLGILLSCLRA
jgi:hypothetical protein